MVYSSLRAGFLADGPIATSLCVLLLKYHRSGFKSSALIQILILLLVAWIQWFTISSSLSSSSFGVIDLRIKFVKSRTDYFVRIPPSTMVVIWLPTFRICVTTRSVTVCPLSLSENLKVFKNPWFAHTSLFSWESISCWANVNFCLPEVCISNCQYIYSAHQQ